MAIVPVSRSKTQARATYDNRSRGYERIEGRLERHARIAANKLLAVAPNEHVVEVGSGPGMSLTTFARAVGSEGYVVGIDISPRMHLVAAARLHDEGVAGRASLIVGDGACLPIRTGSMDAAFASFTVELFDTPELPVVFSELHRVLRPIGRLAIVSLTTTDPPANMERAYLLAHKIMPRLADCRPIPLTSLITEGGFTVIDQRRCDIVGIPTIAVTARRSELS